MTIEQFELMICDMYQLDEWLPSPVFERKEFTKNSYSQWAIGEFRNYLVKRIYPRTVGTVDEFIEIAGEFIKKMDQFAKLNANNRKMFSIARDIASDIQEVFRAMK